MEVLGIGIVLGGDVGCVSWRREKGEDGGGAVRESLY